MIDNSKTNFELEHFESLDVECFIIDNSFANFNFMLNTFEAGVEPID